jgi:hypothetical protein
LRKFINAIHLILVNLKNTPFICFTITFKAITLEKCIELDMRYSYNNLAVKNYLNVLFKRNINITYKKGNAHNGFKDNKILYIKSSFFILFYACVIPIAEISSINSFLIYKGIEYVNHFPRVSVSFYKDFNTIFNSLNEDFFNFNLSFQV